MGFFWGPRLKCTSARPICCRRPRAAKALDSCACSAELHSETTMLDAYFDLCQGSNRRGGMATVHSD
jgi:hypothetical protein